MYMLVDATLPREIEAQVRESLRSPLLLPPLASRMNLLYSLLPKSPEDWGQLSRGQRFQLEILVNNLEDHSHIASLLGYSSTDECCDVSYETSTLPRDLMHTLLANLGFHAKHQLNQILEDEPLGRKDPSSSKSQPSQNIEENLNQEDFETVKSQTLEMDDNGDFSLHCTSKGRTIQKTLQTSISAA
ncbi:hypothetical protein SK128_003010, partial [Halocaridina rubra]